MITAEVVCDSVSPVGHRLTTVKIKCPRFIWDEVLTHRAFSRNASSLRAIPTVRLIGEVADPETRARPAAWGKNQRGMDADEELAGLELELVQMTWDVAAEAAVRHAHRLARLGAHKQLVNRVLMPYVHVNGVITATEYDNFFGLRLGAADPTVQAVAEAMWAARQASTPQLLAPGDWHLPFWNEDDILDADLPPAVVNREFKLDPIHWTPTPDYVPDMVKVSVARCARVSYESFVTGRRSTVAEDLALYEKLVGAQPLHASPAEHQATPDGLNWPNANNDYIHPNASAAAKAHHFYNIWQNPHEHGNFIGWRQWRKMLPGEAVAPLPEGYQ